MYKDLLDLIEKVTGLKVVFSRTTTIEPCITYTVNPVSDNGAKAVDMLSLRIIHYSVGECYKADTEIRKALLDMNLKSEAYTKVRLNGGGYTTHEDTNTVHKMAFYYITRKSEVL
jgi:hypothetical protein